MSLLQLFVNDSLKQTFQAHVLQGTGWIESVETNYWNTVRDRRAPEKIKGMILMTVVSPAKIYP